MSRARRRSTEQHVPKEAQTNYKKCGSRYRQKQNFVPLCCFGRLHTAAHTENPVMTACTCTGGSATAAMPARQAWHISLLFVNPSPLQREQILHLLLHCTELQTVLLLLERKFMKHQTKENADKLLYRG